MTLTKRELEDINEELVLENRRLRAENGCLVSTLANSTAQYKELSARQAEYEERYRELTEQYGKLEEQYKELNIRQEELDERNKELTEQYGRLTRRYERLKSTLIASLDEEQSA
jgi:hypothetical protein